MADNTGDLRLQVSTEVNPELKIDKANIQKSIDDINALLSKEFGGAVNKAFKDVLTEINNTLKKGDLGKLNIGKWTNPILKELSKNPENITGKSIEEIYRHLEHLNTVIETINWAKTEKSLEGFKTKIENLCELPDVELQKVINELNSLMKKSSKHRGLTDEWKKISDRLTSQEQKEAFDKQVKTESIRKYGAPSKRYRSVAAIEADDDVPEEIKHSIVKTQNGGGKNLDQIKTFLGKFNEFKALKDQIIDKVFNGDENGLSDGFIIPKDLKKSHKELEEIYMLYDRIYNKMMEMSKAATKLSTNGTDFKSYELIAKEIKDFFDPEKGIVNQNLTASTYTKQARESRDAIFKTIRPQLFRDNGVEEFNAKEEAARIFAEAGERHTERQKNTSHILTRGKNPNAGKNYNPETAGSYISSGSINALDKPLDVIPEDSEKDLRTFQEQMTNVINLLDKSKMSAKETQEAFNGMMDTAARISKDLSGDILNRNDIGKPENRLKLAEAYRSNIESYRKKYKDELLNSIFQGSYSEKGNGGSGSGGNGGGNSDGPSHDVPVNKEKLTSDINEAINKAFTSEHEPININTGKLTEDIKTIIQNPVSESEKAPSESPKTISVNKVQLRNDINSAINSSFSEEHSPININKENLTAEINKAVEAARKISVSLNDKEPGSKAPLPSDNQINELFIKLQGIQELTKKFSENPLNIDVSAIERLKEILDTINVETLKDLTEGLKLLSEVNLSGFSIEHLDLSKLSIDGIKAEEIREIAEGLKLLSQVKFGNADLTKLDFSKLRTEGIDVQKLSSIFWMFSNLGKIKIPVLDLSKLNFDGLNTEKLDIKKLKALSGLDFKNLSVFRDLDFSKLNTKNLSIPKPKDKEASSGHKDSPSSLLLFNNQVEKFKSAQSSIRKGGFNEGDFTKMQDSMQKMQALASKLPDLKKVQDELKKSQKALGDTQAAKEYSDVLSGLIKKIEEYSKKKKDIETNANNHAANDDIENLKKLRSEIDRIVTTLNANDSDNFRQKLSDIDKSVQNINHSAYEKLRKEIDAVGKSYADMSSQGKAAFKALQDKMAAFTDGQAIPDNIRDSVHGFSKNRDYYTANSSRVRSIYAQYENWKSKNTVAVNAYSNQIKDMDRRFSTALSGQSSKAEVESLNAAYKELAASASAAGKTGSTVIEQISGRLRNLAVYLSSFVSIFTLFNKIREGISTVKEFDTAMTNLRKVAEGSEQAVSDFGNSSYKLADSLGAVNSAVIEAAAEWSRLGYNIKEANELAKASVVYSNVGELSATEATTGLVASLKAFNLEAADAMSVVSKLNEIGNNYAVSSAQLGEIVEKSASSIALGGDSIDQLLAMGAAMNEVVQDASVVGNTLKTAALRIRGAKTSLEEAGLETENMAESTSKLRKEIAGLTNVAGKGGFDIMKDADTFKSTYEIFDGIAERWKDMSNINQAALLEKIAGKQRSNGVAALLSNWDKAKEALQDSINSEGSALAENEKYMESIEAHQMQMKNAWAQVWTTAINKDVVNFFVDLGTGIGHATKNIGLFQTALSAAMALYASKVTVQNGGFLEIDNNGNRHFSGKNVKEYLGSVFKGQKASPIMGEDTFNRFLQQKVPMGFNPESTESVDQYISSLQKIVEEDKNAADASRQAEAALAKQLIGMKGTIPSYNQYCQKIKDENAANKAATVSTIAHTAAMTAASAAVTFGISAAVTFAITKIIEFANASENAIEKGRQAREEIKEIHDSLNSISETVDSDGEKFAKLSEGVDKNGKNVSLTSDEYREFLKINNDLAEAFPALTRTYDENGNALVRLGDNAKEITKNLNDLLDAQRKLSNQQIADKMGDNLKGIRETDRKYKEAMQSAKFDIEDQRKMLEKLTSQGFKENVVKRLNNNASNIGDDDLQLVGMISARLGLQGKDRDVILEDVDAVVNDIIKELDTRVSDNQAVIDKYTNLNKANWNGLTESLLASIETTDAYQTLSDGFRGVIKQSVANIDWSSIDFGKSKDDMLKWINDNLYSLFDGSLQTADGRSLTPMIEEYFEAKTKVENGKMSVGEFQDKIESLYSVLSNIDPETVKMIHFILDLDTDGKGTTVEQAMNKVRGFLDKNIPDLEKKLKGLTAKELEIAKNFDIPKDVRISWEDFIRLIKQAGEELDDLPKTEDLGDINKQKSGLDSLYNKYESGTTVTTSTGSRLSKGGSNTSYKSSKEVKKVNALSVDDVASTLEANPEYERYITKIGDQYVLNMNAAEDWNKSIEKQKALIDAQLNGFGYVDQYNEMYARLTSPDSHILSDGVGNTDLGVSAEQLDSLSKKMIEFQDSIRDGSMSLQQFYTALHDESGFDALKNSLENTNGTFNETTDYIEEMTAMLSSSLGASITASTRQFIKGTKGAKTYTSELVSGSKIVSSLARSLFGITEANGEYISSCEDAEGVTDEFKTIAKNAAGSFGEFQDALSNASAIEGVIAVFQKYHDTITKYTDDNGSWMESMAQDVNYDSMVSEFSDAIADMAAASESFKDEVCSNLEQISPEVSAAFSDALQEGEADTEEASNILSQALSGDVTALQAMAKTGAQNIGIVIGDLANSVGDVLSKLGEAIKNFDFKITLSTPNINIPSLRQKFIDSLVKGTDVNIPAQNFDFKFSGNGENSAVEALGNALTEMGNNLKTTDFSALFEDFDPFASDEDQKGNKEAPKRPNSRNHGSGGGKGSGGKAETEKDFDWTTVYLDNLKKKYDELETYVNDASNAYSDMTANVRELTKAEKELEKVNISEDGRMTFLGRESALKDMLSVGDEMIDFYERQITAYDKGLDDLKKKIDGLFGTEEGEKLWKKITEGSLDPEEWKDTYRYKSNSQIDKDKMDAISDASKLKKEKDEAEKNLRTQHKIQIENTRKLFEFRQEKLENEMKQMDREMKKFQDALSIKATIGLVVNKSDYNTLISEADNQISKYESKISLLNQRIAEETALNPNFLGSSDYFNLEDTIGECEESIRSARIQQMEWNEEIKKLPVKRAEQFVSSMQNVLSSYNNFISQLEAENKQATLDQIQTGFTLQEKLIEAYRKQISEAAHLQKTYQKGSDNWYEMESAIQSAKDGISQAVVEMKNFNQKLLEIPIENLNKVAVKLQNIKAALDEMVSDDETAISTALDVVNRRIEELQKGFEEKQKHYEEDLINPLKEQLDLLNKQNEARQRQLALEQARYDLERAHDEKTVQVEKNGELVWASDEDAVRNAQNNLRDAEFADMIGRLQDQIDAYNKELDDANKKVGKQADLWEKIAEQWSKLTSDRQYEKNLDKSLNMLRRFFPDIDKDSFENMSLNGNKSKMYDELKKSYSADMQKQTEVEKAIDQNGRATTLMERVKELVTNGTISASEANGILNRIREASKDDFSSLELLEQTLSVEQTTSVNKAISNAQKANDKAYAQFQKSLDAVRSNTSVISKYTAAWDSVKSSALEQVSELKTMNKKLGEIKDSIEDIDFNFNFDSDSKKKVKEPDKKLKPGNSGGSGGFVYEYGSNARSGNRPKGGDTVKYKDSKGNVVDLIIGKSAHYAKGIENGAIQEPDSHRAEILKRLATSRLKRTEVPIIADIGEVVLNPDQQEQLLENFRNSVLGTSSIYPVGVPSNGGNSNVNVTFGDIHVEGVQNPDEFAHAINNQFELTINQNYSKIFKH